MTDRRWVVFDYGGVISRDTAALPAMADRLGVEQARFEAAYWPHRDGLDAGTPYPDYWRAVGGDLGVEVDEPTGRALTELDIAGWLETEADSLALLAELDAAGTPLALLSNAPSAFGRAAERQDWTRHFQHLVFSGDLGLVKPAPEIWAALTARLGASPGDCLFLDDRPVNVAGAREAGMAAAHWTGAAAARPVLAEFGAL